VLNTINYNNNLETVKEIVWVYPETHTAFVPMAKEIMMDKKR
jgi:hypothetical protein